MISVFDIETHDWDKIYAIGYTFDGIDANMVYADNKGNDYFIKWLLENLPEGIIYSHNGGKFDNLFIFDYCIKHGIDVFALKVIHSSLARFAIKYNGKRLEFRDSFLIMPASLKNLTNSFNVAHKKLAMDYDLGINDLRFKEYFKNDILGLYELIKIAKAQGLTNKLTIASASMHNYLENFYTKKPEPLASKVKEFIKPFYYGGRCEVFKRYGRDLNYYDINSLYPYVMQKYRYTDLDAQYYNSRQFSECGFYFCNIKTPQMNIPFLPIKSNSGKLIFAQGSFKSVITGAELKYARSLGYDINVIMGFIPQSTDYIFKEFVAAHYADKKNAQGAKREIAKLFLNSLYGKFGQKDMQKSYKMARLKDIADKEIITDKDLEFIIGNYYLKPIEKLAIAKYSRLDIAMQITSNARIELYNLFKRAEFDIYYCDTDSIFTPKELSTSSEIGDIKLENRISEFVAIEPKFYAYKTTDGKEVVRSKGFKASDMDFNRIKDMLSSNTRISSNYSHLNYFKDYIKKGILYNYSIQKTSKSEYDKRMILADGINTEPLSVNL